MRKFTGKVFHAVGSTYRRHTEIRDFKSAEFTKTDPEDVSALPDYYFLLIPNNSGSTIMAQYLASQIGGFVPPFGHYEGQHIPELRTHMRTDPWAKDTQLDWKYIRSVWDEYRNGQTFVESSPPNLMRIDQIRNEFKSSAQYIAALGNPYHYIASCYFNYNRSRPRSFGGLTRQWLQRAKLVRYVCKTFGDIPFISYEDFCEDPKRMNQILGLETDLQAQIEGKPNTKVKEIRNLGVRTTSFLTAAEVDEISHFLEPHRAFLDQFGYSVVSGQEMVASFSEQPEEFRLGLERRRKWESANLK